MFVWLGLAWFGFFWLFESHYTPFFLHLILCSPPPLFFVFVFLLLLFYFVCLVGLHCIALGCIGLHWVELNWLVPVKMSTLAMAFSADKQTIAQAPSEHSRHASSASRLSCSPHNIKKRHMMVPPSM